MNNDNQIEKIAKLLHNSNADWAEYTRSDLSLALKLYNENVRIIPKNAVVMTREELKKQNNGLVEAFSKKVKELLEEREYKAGCSAHMMWTETAKACVEEIAKEFTIEKKPTN